MACHAPPEPTANPRPQAAGFAGGAYRPPTRMAKRVKARDRRCRFPGCTIAAVFCDLDHVRPWPHGPTADTNLICLCRRHHRVKQRPGWAVALAPDATVTWTDPTGLVRTTAPADALTGTVLSGAATSPPPPASTSITLTDLPDGPHSDLEFHLEHHVARVPTRCRATSAWVTSTAEGTTSSCSRRWEQCLPTTTGRAAETDISDIPGGASHPALTTRRHSDEHFTL